MVKKIRYEITDDMSDYMYNTIDNIIKHAGPRAPGSPAERKAAEWVEEELKKSCDSVEMEEFQTYPGAFMGWIRLAIGFWIISFLLFMLRDLNPFIISIISLCIGVFILLIAYEQFLCYKEWTPKIFPYKEATSQNVVGIIKPESTEIKKRVVIAGHLDSAFRFNLIQHTWQGYAYFLFGGILSLFVYLVIYLMAFIYALIAIDLVILTLILTIVIMGLPIFVAFFFLILGKSDKVFFGAFSYIKPHAIVIILCFTAYNIIIDILLFNFVFIEPTIVKTAILQMIGATPSFIMLFFFTSRKAVPGAVDNLTAVATAMCVGKVVKEWKDQKPEYFPKNTEVVISIVGCEEIGLRGSEAFGKKHAAEYNKIDTTVVNLESLTIYLFL